MRTEEDTFLALVRTPIGQMVDIMIAYNRDTLWANPFDILAEHGWTLDTYETQRMIYRKVHPYVKDPDSE